MFVSFYRIIYILFTTLVVCLEMKKSKKTKKRGLSKTVKVSISMPSNMLDWIDEVATISEVTRSEVVQWVFTGIMGDDDLAEVFFDPVEIEEEEED